MTFMNSSIDSKFQFLNVALAEFFPIHEKHGKLFFFFWNIHLGCTSRFFITHRRVGKFWSLKLGWFHILLNYEDIPSNIECL